MDSNDVLQQTLSHDVTLSLVNNQLIIVNISSPVNLRTYLIEVILSNPAGQFDHAINVFPFGKLYITCYVVCVCVISCMRQVFLLLFSIFLHHLTTVLLLLSVGILLM